MFFGLKFLFYNYEKFAPKMFEPNLTLWAQFFTFAFSENKKLAEKRSWLHCWAGLCDGVSSDSFSLLVDFHNKQC